MVVRTFSLKHILGKTPQSILLFGARGTGKTSLVSEFLSDQRTVLNYNLLLEHEYSRFVLDPKIFSDEILELLGTVKGLVTVFVDEIQRLPMLLNFVHDLIEKHPKNLRFTLTGSSGRKL